MKKDLIIVMLLLACGSIVAQSNKPNATKEYSYEVCVFKKGSPGHVIKNQLSQQTDTTIAFVSGQVLEKQEPLPFVNVTFTDAGGQTLGTSTDTEGKYKIHIKAGEYSVKFSYIGSNSVIIQKLPLAAGQRQEVSIDLGKPSGYHTYEINSKTPLSEKDLKKKEKELSKD